MMKANTAYYAMSLLLFTCFFTSAKQIEGDGFNLKYHQLINQANRALYNSNWSLADEYFDHAFDQMEVPFYIDLKKAIITSQKLKNYPKRDALLYYTIEKKRLTLPVFVQEFPFLSKKNLLTKYRKALDNNEPKQVSFLQEKLDELYQVNQELLDKKITRDIKGAEYQKVLDEQALTFLSIINSYGFPSEDEIGAFWDYKNETESRIYRLVYNLLRASSALDILAQLEVAVEGNMLHPSIYASLSTKAFYDSRGLMKVKNYLNFSVVELSGEGLPYRPILYISDHQFKEINTNRIAVGLDSVHIVQEQIVCCRYCPNTNVERMLSIAPYVMIDQLPMGLVRSIADEEGADLNDYLLNVDWITRDCECREKEY